MSEQRSHLKRSCTTNNSVGNHDDSEEEEINFAGVEQLISKSTSIVPKHIIQPVKTAHISDEVKNVYCIPMECADPVPLPDARLKELLDKYGLKSQVRFTPHLTPAKIREDISRAFASTFSLRSQELLQFDYLSLMPDQKMLTKPQNMHFDSKAILSFAGDDDVFILLRQNSPTPNIKWKQLLQRESHIKNLGEDEYREIMLSVMYRLSSGKHKKDSTQYQQEFIESLLEDYKLNSYHQLVHTGHGLQQLVLFTEKRRYEAFTNAHLPSHLDAQQTFNKVFKTYYWRGMEEWITAQVNACPDCSKKSTSTVAANVIPKTTGKKTSAKKRKLDEVISQVKTSSQDADSSSSVDNKPEDTARLQNNFCTDSMLRMYELQKQAKFCDFGILLLPSISNGLDKAKTYDVHRVVLAAISSRIRDIPKTTIKIGGNVTAESLESIIEYAYTGRLDKIEELPLTILSQISNTALALNVKIDDYLQTVRPDFIKSSATKVLVTKDPANS